MPATKTKPAQQARTMRSMAPSRRQRSPSTEAPAAVPATVPPRRLTLGWLLGLTLLLLLGLGVVWTVVQQRRGPRFYGYEVVKAYPHDPSAYTQGLVFHDGYLYEGTGKYGESTLRKVDLESGRVLQSLPLARDQFGEGITIKDGRIYQLTWQQGIALVYDLDNFREAQRFRYAGEGWGLTHDGTHLVMSDGSATLQFLDPQTFRVVRRLLVHSRGRRVDKLNELEFIGGEIFANIWYKDQIARISPATGEVTGWIDLRGLWAARRDREAVLNGIAYDQEHDRLFVTGKNWPQLYEIRLVAR